MVWKYGVRKKLKNSPRIALTKGMVPVNVLKPLALMLSKLLGCCMCWFAAGSRGVLS